MTMEQTKLTIRQWAEEDKPCERLLNVGAESLTNNELIAILVGSGTRQFSAVEIAENVMRNSGFNLNQLGKTGIHELMTIPGVGKYTACKIMAACELGKRRQMSSRTQRQSISSAAEIYQYLHPRMMDLQVEEAWVLLLNQHFDLIKATRISHGGITETAVDIRVIMKEAILSNATCLALAHNHPSGSNKPSSEDDKLTQRVKRACETMRIFFLDHVIVCDGNYFSFHENGRL